MIYSSKAQDSTIAIGDVTSGTVPTTSLGLSIGLTPPAGQRVILTGLSTNGVINTGITITVGGNTVYTGSFANGSDSTFTVGSNTSYTGTTPPYKQIESIEGGTDETITIVSANTVTKTFYSYSFGR